MWTLFVKSMQQLPSAQAMITNSGSNLITSVRKQSNEVYLQIDFDWNTQNNKNGMSNLEVEKIEAQVH